MGASQWQYLTRFQRFYHEQQIYSQSRSKARWSKEIDPADISRAALRKAAVGTGIASNAEEAKQIVDNLKVNGLETQTNKGKRFVEKSDVGFGQWMKQRTDGQGRWVVQAGKDDIANLRDSARELQIGNPDVAIALPIDATQQADAGVLLAGALALPKIAKELPKAAVLAGEAVPPLLIVTGGVLGAGALVHQHVGVVKSNWEDLQKASVMPLPMTMDDAEPMPVPVPDGQATERPFAEPNAKPKVTDLPSTPTDTTIAPVPKAKPEATIDNLPQPYTPDAPQNQQPPTQNTPQSPRLNPKDILPPLIGGGTGFVLGKAAHDNLGTKMPKVKQPWEVAPSMQPDAARKALGTAETIRSGADERMKRGITRQNEAAQVLAKVGYDVEQQPQITDIDRMSNPWFKGTRKPDYKVEGEIFDGYAPDANTTAKNIRDYVEDKVEERQTRRIVLNLDDSKVTLEELAKAIKHQPVLDLEQILVVKNGQITKFFPLKN